MAVATAYCTEADMQRLFSIAGVTSFADHDQDGVSDTLVVSDCIDQATEEINLYAWQYSAAGLATSTLVNRWCTVLAVYFLCQRRGNPPPDSIAEEFARIMLHLERIRTGDMKIPGVATKGIYSPRFSNLVPDRRFPYSNIRVQRESSDGIPTTLTQKVAGDIPIE